MHLLTHGDHHTLSPVLVTYEPGGELVGYETHATQEMFWMVLEGEVEVTMGGRDPFLLLPGDSILIPPGARSAPATFVTSSTASGTRSRPRASRAPRSSPSSHSSAR